MNLASFELIRAKANIVSTIGNYIKLRPKGAGEYLGLCPFHNEKTPSFTVNTSKNFYHCFGCAAHGDVIKFMAAIQNVSYKQAALNLAEAHGIHLEQHSPTPQYSESLQVYQVLERANEFFSMQLNTKAKDYLFSRNLILETIKKFELGFAPIGNNLVPYLQNNKIAPILIDKAGLLGKNEQGHIYEIFRNRIIFPIRNSNQKLIGFGGRALDNKLYPKYLNSPETVVFKKKEALYGEHLAFAAASKAKHILVVEGYMDCITLHQHGFQATVATLGTAVSEAHLNKLWQVIREVIICLDGDAAGQRAANRVMELALAQVSNSNVLSFILLPQNLDPEEFLRYYGNQEFQTLIEHRLTLSQAAWRNLASGYSKLSTAEDRTQLEANLQELCDKVKDKILQKNYRQFFREQCWRLFSGQEREKAQVASTKLMDTLPATTSSLTNIECNLLAICIQNLEQIEIINNLSEIKFTNEYLEDFKEFLCEQISSHHDSSITLFKVAVENSAFKTIYQKLLGLNNIFFDRIKFKDQLNDLWLLLKSQHYFAQLQAEYGSLSENDTSKLQTYRQEIINLRQQINTITKNLID